ncbi:MAG: bifunctional metallophosphatase/5'-nucleotidase [Bacteroidales bacterium]|nr:bifunctional metallophosphatase/5'-nucleotidase [Candidatus Liminaster caballi]
MKKRSVISTFAFVVMLIALAFQSCKNSETVEIIFVHTNDTHSQVDGIYLDERPVGGVVERAAILEMMRQEDPQLVYLDAGDMVQGSPYFNVWNGQIEMKAMNLQGLIATTFGNHEFDNGLDFLDNMLNYACFPILSCNYDTHNTPIEKYVRPSMIIERKGVKIGITGVTVDPNNLIFDKNWKGITFTDPSVAANREARRLKEQGCDLVILLSHVGYFAGDSVGDRRIAAMSSDIDIIIGGHTHTNLENGEIVYNVNGKPVVITQTGAKTSPMGLVRVSLQAKGKHTDGTAAYVVDEIACSKLHPDLYDLHNYGRVMNDFITPYRDSLDFKMNDVLGIAAHDLPRFRPQSPLGNFTSDALRTVGSRFYDDKPIDVGVMNVGGLRNDLLAGNIRLGDIYRIFPFENTLCILELKGSDLIEMVNQSADKKLEAFSGMQVTIQNVEEKTKIVDIKVNGQPIDPKKTYSIATIDYLAEGNDGLRALRNATMNLNTGLLLRNLMVDYIKELTRDFKRVDSNIDDRVIELTEL